MGTLIGISLLSLIFLGVPIAYALGLTSVIVIFEMGMPSFLKIIPQRIFAGIDLFPLMAMPFYIFAGEIMNETKITDRLVAFANLLVGHLKGGLAQVNVVVSILFAGLTGAAVSDTAALGSMLIPAMEKDGYDTEFSAAITAASSIIGPTIPPSIIMVVYGSIMQVSIAGLFAAGIIPGLIIGIVLMIMNRFIAKKRDYPQKESQLEFKKVVFGFKDALLALVLPLIILGGILFGIFTPTEAGAVAVIYGLFLGFAVYRNLKLKDLWRLMYNTARTTGMVFIIIATASILSWFIASEQIPESIASLILNISNNRFVVLTLINVMLLVVGMFMDITAALIMLGPIFAPLAISVGVDPLHFGFIMVLSLNIGLMTPPLGACLYVACGIADLKIEQISKGIWPFIIAEVLILFLVSFIPAISMFLPKLLGFG